MRQSNSARAAAGSLFYVLGVGSYFLLLPATLDGAPEGSGLMMTRCSTARMAMRLRSTLHDSHASRTRSEDVTHDGGRSGEPVIFRRALVILPSVRCRISSQSARSMVLSE